MKLRTRRNDGRDILSSLFFFTLVTVPPQKPNIIDDQGIPVSTVAGPYEEGGVMKLHCYVFGGKLYFL